MDLRAAQDVASWMEGEAQAPEGERLPVRCRERGAPSQRARLGGLEQLLRRTAGHHPLRQDGGRAAGVGEKPERWPPSRLEIERVAADSEAVGGALDFGRIGPLPHALHVAVERTSAKVVSAWGARAGP